MSSEAAIERLRRHLFAPVDVASLVFFRICFGAIMIWEVVRYFDNGWISGYWIEPVFNFKYYGFEWVHPWPGDGMYYHMVGIGVLGVLIVLGFRYRVSMTLFFFTFTYTFLLEQARYLNHLYLVCLLGFLLIFVPAHRDFSLDALRKPAFRSQAVPAWPLWLLRAQLGIVYFYGGLAKLNADWLQGEPMRTWLGNLSTPSLVGPFFESESVVMFFTFGGLLLDLFVVPALFWRRTRPVAFVIAVIFHLTNAWIFQIGVFPWFMIAATTIYFSPDWPRRLAGRFLRTSQMSRQSIPLPSRPSQNATMVLLGLYIALQALVPLRHYLYPGNVSWTEEGHRFAWHMKLRDKQATATFRLTTAESGLEWQLDPGRYLASWQVRKMSSRPDMVLQFSHFLAEKMRREGYTQVEVRATVQVSLNGRNPVLLIDPEIDLAAASRTLRHQPWVLPLTEPLRARE